MSYKFLFLFDLWHDLGELDLNWSIAQLTQIVLLQTLYTLAVCGYEAFFWHSLACQSVSKCDNLARPVTLFLKDRRLKRLSFG